MRSHGIARSSPIEALDNDDGDSLVESGSLHIARYPRIQLFIIEPPGLCTVMSLLGMCVRTVCRRCRF
jgi:hypothetical protein